MIEFLAATQSKIEAGDLPNAREITASDVSNMLAIVFAILGSLAFLVIVIAGLRYISAAGDPQKTAQARNTIFYAVLGLVLAIFAEIIVAFVVRRIA